MRIGLIGLGNMGAGMARNIRAAGFDLTVYDVREEAMAALERVGASRGPSPAAVARAVDVVLTSLPGPDQVASVTVGAEGVLEGIGRDAVLVETSTSRPTLIREVARRFAAKGAHVLDAPVSGGKEGAENRNLAVMVGGRREVFDRVRPVLELLLAGLSEKEAASRLGLSRHTVHEYTKALYRAFGVHSRGELLAQFVSGLPA